MSLVIEFHGNNALIRLSGALDYSTQDEMQEAQTSVLSADHINGIEVDLSNVTFMDSSAIRALLLLQSRATAAKKSLILLNCPAPILDIFEIGGFDNLFTIRRED